MSARGDVVLVRRDRDGALELRVNGVFVMDTAETSSERLLARTALDWLAERRGGAQVLIGGLGLGFTLQEVLGDRRVGSVVVAEIEPDLVAWHRDGLVEATAGATHDPRVRVIVGDVRDIVAAQASMSVDLVLLDVDNGPGFLVYDDNAALYQIEFLTGCHRVTRVGGVSAVWSSDESDQLKRSMSAVFGQSRHVPIPVQLGTRESTYHVYLGRRLP